MHVKNLNFRNESFWEDGQLKILKYCYTFLGILKEKLLSLFTFKRFIYKILHILLIWVIRSVVNKG